jgi:hypothetical protein
MGYDRLWPQAVQCRRWFEERINFQLVCNSSRRLTRIAAAAIYLFECVCQRMEAR